MSESKYRALLVEIQEKVEPRDDYNRWDLWDRVQQALADPVQAEPVAWLNVAADSVTNQLVVVMDWDDEGDEVQSLYLHPPAAQPNQHSRDSKELRDLCSQRDGFKAELWRAEGERDKLAAELAELKAKMEGMVPDSVVWIDEHHIQPGNNPSFIRDVALVSAVKTAETQVPLVRLNAAMTELAELKTKSSGVVPAALGSAFITCESSDAGYRVVIKSETLQAAQQVHNWIARLNPSTVSAGEAVARRVLLLCSYCGEDDANCTDEAPCVECLKMCNVAMVSGDMEVLGGLDYLGRVKAAAAETDEGGAFCDGHCTWLDHQPGCPRAEPAEAVEVVCITQGGCNVTWTATKELTPAGTELMSVNQHKRLMANHSADDLNMVKVPRELRPVLAMILNALDRDAAEGRQARGEMAEELRALLGGAGCD